MLLLWRRPHAAQLALCRWKEELSAAIIAARGRGLCCSPDLVGGCGRGTLRAPEAVKSRKPAAPCLSSVGPNSVPRDPSGKWSLQPLLQGLSASPCREGAAPASGKKPPVPCLCNRHTLRLPLCALPISRPCCLPGRLLAAEPLPWSVRPAVAPRSCRCAAGLAGPFGSWQMWWTPESPTCHFTELLCEHSCHQNSLLLFKV